MPALQVVAPWTAATVTSSTHAENEDGSVVTWVFGRFVACVFDGHGQNAAQLSRDILPTTVPRVLARNLWSDAALRSSICALDGSLPRKKFMHGGSTAVCAVVDPEQRMLRIVNLGDSRAAVFDGDSGDVLFVTSDHCPSKPSERKRIENTNGGECDGKGGRCHHRVRVGRVDGLLAVSRGFGDFALKPAVSCQAETTSIHVTRPLYVALMSDGMSVRPHGAFSAFLAELGNACARMEASGAYSAEAMSAVAENAVHTRGFSTDDRTVLLFRIAAEKDCRRTRCSC